MVFVDEYNWYADDGQLSRTICELTEKLPETSSTAECCACDQAKYKVLQNISFHKQIASLFQDSFHAEVPITPRDYGAVLHKTLYISPISRPQIYIWCDVIRWDLSGRVPFVENIVIL